MAFAFMVVSAAYQRVTGPTFPYLGFAHVDGRSMHFKLPRSAVSEAPLVITIPHAPKAMVASLGWRPHHSTGPYTIVLMQRNAEALSAQLPGLPPGVKIEYRISIKTAHGQLVIPAHRDIVLRFKGDIPPWALIPHISFLLLAVLFGMRTLLEALYRGPRLRLFAWLACGCIIIGGMLLGPLVQWFAFGAWWTGIPFGWDVTDNKTLFMLICWIGVLIAIHRHREPTRRSRRMIIVGAVVMLLVYLVPHSLFGTEVRLEQTPADAAPFPTAQPAPMPPLPSTP
jgi:hypothetical protein